MNSAVCSIALSNFSFASTGRSGSNWETVWNRSSNTMGALQQCVVKLARDACALADARIQRQVELTMQLPDAQLVGRPQQRQEKRPHRGRGTNLFGRRQVKQ